MKIGIVGASSSGLYMALFLKKRHPDFSVSLFDQTSKIGKKLLATGNGHCNLFHLGLTGKEYNRPDYVSSCLAIAGKEELLNALSSLGVMTTKVGDLVYPLSYSAKAYVSYLEQLALKLGVRIELGKKVIDYQGTDLVFENETKHFDSLIFATGGASQPNLGSDGSLFSVFAKHGYNIAPLQPALCPIKTKENTKSISGVRHKALVRLYKGKELIYEENGEVLFKDDGLSGIAIFNCQSMILRNGKGDYRIALDLFPNLSKKELSRNIEASKSANPSSFPLAFLEKELADYILKRASSIDGAVLAEAMKNMTFTYASSYPFSASQVTSGGIDIANIDTSFRSKIEENISFVGECLDVDGLCGGYNLAWCLLSAYLCAKSL